MRPQRRIGRLVNKADFERLIAVPPRGRSAHFAVHHLPGSSSASVGSAPKVAKSKLSTDGDGNRPRAVDNSLRSEWAAHWLGVVLPKRNARRAVTRNLMRRLIRTRMQECLERLPAGLWVVRLRASFPTREFRAASSHKLRDAISAELSALFAEASR